MLRHTKMRSKSNGVAYNEPSSLFAYSFPYKMKAIEEETFHREF